MLQLSCHKAFVTAEWLIRGHRLRGLRRVSPASISMDSLGGEIKEIVMAIDQKDKVCIRAKFYSKF